MQQKNTQSIQSTDVASTADATQSTPIIRMDNVRREYTMGDSLVVALDGVSFDVHQGEFLSIMGPSGSGKSTCMNMIGCLDRATSGDVIINGQKTKEMTEKELAQLRNQTVGFVFQQYHLLSTMSVLENVMLPLRYKGLPIDERKVLAEEALCAVGLEDRLKHRPHELSGGQKQRVAIARAMVTKPHIILADEPTGALDSKTGQQVLDLFWDINRGGTTIIIVTHDFTIGQSLPRTIQLLDGRITNDTTNKREPQENAPREYMTGEVYHV